MPITLTLPDTPEILELLKPLLSANGVTAAIADGDDVTLRQGAAIAGVNYYTFRGWVVDEDKIPYHRPSGKQNGRIKIRRADLNNFLHADDKPAAAQKKPTKKAGRPRQSYDVPLF